MLTACTIIGWNLHSLADAFSIVEDVLGNLTQGCTKPSQKLRFGCVHGPFWFEKIHIT